MKRLVYLLITLCLVGGILLFVVANVNHGHGPGYVYDPYGSSYDSNSNDYDKNH
jgi:hypothetical protein